MSYFFYYSILMIKQIDMFSKIKKEVTLETNIYAWECFKHLQNLICIYIHYIYKNLKINKIRLFHSLPIVFFF